MDHLANRQTNISAAKPFVAPLGNLSHLGFGAFAPHDSLREWVQCYWLVQCDALPNGGYTEKLYPDGGTSLTFYFSPGQLPLILFDARHDLTSRHFQGCLDTIGIRFQPGGAFQLFGQQIADTIGGEIPALELQLINLPLLQRQLVDCQHNQQRLMVIERWLLQHAKQQNAQTGVIQHLWPKLLKTSNNLAELTQSLNLSRRQIERKFQSEIGLSPAYIKLLHNIKAARRLISQAPKRSLTDIGLECGFYDQAHFIRQFRKITQQTPGQYKAKKMSQIYNSVK
ncbi:helix-turn-helix domain-containing protein [Paraglaciecola sp.]|uniref:helix-turn-helix domain-containing protein n=1 Tax=Paraglaciecola sp. TaxID=1920173 RepID=UPI0030F39096